jgi:tRNA G18 (ribose-2'-O)-methylase SpoU
MTDERVPFLATVGAEPYDALTRIPVALLLDDIRSLYNVGAFFRTADAAGIDRIHLSGITARPPHQGLAKTALGAEETVPWQAASDPVTLLATLRTQGFQIAAVETSPHAVDLFDWKPDFPVCVLFGNEVDGLKPELLAQADLCVRIPMLGIKHSLNVATAGGIVLYELLRKYRNLVESQGGRLHHADPR